MRLMGVAADAHGRYGAAGAVAYAAHPRDQQDDVMLNHVMVGTNDIARARAFYDAVNRPGFRGGSFV